MLDGSLNGTSPIPGEGPLRLLVVRRADLGPLPSAENWSAWSACDTPDGPAPDGMREAAAAGEQRLLNMIKGTAFMPDIPHYAFTDHGGVDDLLSGVISMLISDAASSAYVPGYVDGVPGRLAIITMENEPNTPRVEIAAHAGLPVENIRPDIAGNPALYTVLHEGVHAASGHDESAKMGDYCRDIEPGYLDERVAHETAADRGADIAYTAHTAQDGFMEAVAHARAINALLGNSNSLTAFRYDAAGEPTGVAGDYVVEHITTWGWDPTQPDGRGAFNVAAMRGLPAIPLAVNTMADAVAGYLYEEEQLEAMDRGETFNILTGEDLTEDEMAWWKEVRGNRLARLIGWDQPKPEDITTYLSHYATLGEEARLADPSRHHAAMAFLGRNGHFRTLAKGLKPAYVEAMKDTVMGYQKGIAAITQGIADEDLIRRTGAALEGADFQAIAREIKAPLHDGVDTPLDNALPPPDALRHSARPGQARP